MVRKLLAEIMLRRTKGSKDVNGQQIVQLPPKTQVRMQYARSTECNYSVPCHVICYLLHAESTFSPLLVATCLSVYLASFTYVTNHLSFT